MREIKVSYEKCLAVYKVIEDHHLTFGVGVTVRDVYEHPGVDLAERNVYNCFDYLRDAGMITGVGIYKGGCRGPGRNAVIWDVTTEAYLEDEEGVEEMLAAFYNGDFYPNPSSLTDVERLTVFGLISDHTNYELTQNALATTRGHVEGLLRAMYAAGPEASRESIKLDLMCVPPHGNPTKTEQALSWLISRRFTSLRSYYDDSASEGRKIWVVTIRPGLMEFDVQAVVDVALYLYKKDIR